MSDIVDRLVRFAGGNVCISTDTEVEAAVEIDRLRAENEKLEAEIATLKEIAVRETMNVATLRAALKPLAKMAKYSEARDDDGFQLVKVIDLRAAAAALKETA